MAQRVSVVLVDDLDGGTADGTVAFALDGRRYEIDLSSENESLLRAALQPYIAGARRARPSRAVRGRRRPSATGGAAPAPADTAQASAEATPAGVAEQPEPPEQPGSSQSGRGTVPPATFSSPATQAATGRATRRGSVEIFTHRA